MKEYTIDLSKWRCGEDSSFQLGIGDTQLLNKEGYMCCLGQFGLQCGVDDGILFGRHTPAEVAGDGYGHEFVRNDHCDSDLSNILISINDCRETTAWEKLCCIAIQMQCEGLRLLVTGELPTQAIITGND